MCHYCGRVCGGIAPGRRELEASYVCFLNFPAVQASQPVDVTGLPEEQRQIGAHIAALGVVYPSKVGDQLFLSATFMAEMLSGGKQASTGANVTGFIVVETSFRVYAYTTSPVQVMPRFVPICIPAFYHTVLM